MKAVFLGTLIVASPLVARAAAAPQDQVTVEFLSKRCESPLEARKSLWSLHYTLDTGGDVIVERRFRFMSDAGLARDLAYTGSRPFMRYVFLYVYTPEKTSFATITKAVDRLKAIVAKCVTGNGKVVIEVLPRDWFFANELDEPNEAEQGQTGEVTELESNDGPLPATDEGSNDAPEPTVDGDSDRNAKTLNRGRRLPAPSLQVAVAALRSTRKDASIEDALNFWMVLASSFLEDRLAAAQPNSVTVKLLGKKADSTFRRGPGTSYVRYTLIPWGDIWETGRGGIMTDDRLARDLAYAGSTRHIRYVFLFVDSPEQTRFSDIIKAIDRLKTVIADSVTGKCKVVIEVMPPNWVFVQAPGEADGADPAAASDATDPPPESADEPTPAGSGKADLHEGKGERDLERILDKAAKAHP